MGAAPSGKDPAMSGQAALRRLTERANPVTFGDIIKRLNFGEAEGSTTRAPA